MVRQNNIENDLQDCIIQYLKSFQGSAPWNRWEIVYGFPKEDVFELQKVFIYVLTPKYNANGIKIQGSQIDLGRWALRLGIWNDRISGGAEEIGIAESRLLYAFRHKSQARTATFDVTTDAAYTDTTLQDQGIQIERIEGPYEVLKNVQTNEFRSEFDVYLKG